MKILCLIIGCLTPGIYLAYTDYRYYVLSNKITVPMLILGWLWAWYYGNFLNALTGSVIAFGLFLFIALMGGMSGGDVKLGTALGTWFGFPYILHIIILSGLLGFLWGAIKLVRLKSFKTTLKPIYDSTIMNFFWGIKGNMPLRKLPANGEIIADAVPYGTVMIISTFAIMGFKYLYCSQLIGGI